MRSPKAQLAAWATSIAVIWQSRCSDSINPKYLYLSTIWISELPHVNHISVLKMERGLEWTTLVLSTFTFIFHFPQQSDSTLSMAWRSLSLSAISHRHIAIGTLFLLHQSSLPHWALSFHWLGHLYIGWKAWVRADNPDVGWKAWVRADSPDVVQWKQSIYPDTIFNIFIYRLYSQQHSPINS